MRKAVSFIVIMIVFVLALSSCATKVETKIVKAGATKLPNWVVTTPETRTTIYGWGYGKMSNQINSITFAQTEARNMLAQWVSNAVNQVISLYVKDAGETANNQVIAELEKISVQNATALLSEAKQEDLLVNKDGSVYVLMSFPKSNLEQAIEGYAEKAVGNTILDTNAASSIMLQLSNANKAYWAL